LIFELGLHYPVEIIRKKRDGLALTKEEIFYFINSYLKGKVADYQMSAFLMAVYFNGMNEDEIMALTQAFIDSGETIDLSFIKKPKIDKHSTGGVGDKTSILLAPLAACFDVVVPMMSGRGLGHTGGTLDKLESIPGFRVHLNSKEFKTILNEVGVCMIGQTDSLVPADKKIYALRDVTATVENLGLITSSIVSKKIAEGADGIVYDVKVGYGSTLPSYEKSRKLAQKLVSVTRDFGKESMAILSDMHEPLGYAVGNYLEVEECISLMLDYRHRNRLSRDLVEVTLSLAGAMLLLGGKCSSIEEGASMAEQKLLNRQCYEKFQQMVIAQGGDIHKFFSGLPPVEGPSVGGLPTGRGGSKREVRQYHIHSRISGFISELNAYKFGIASVRLGCGRTRATDQIHYPAGILMKKKVGDEVSQGEPICVLRTPDEKKLEDARDIVSEAIKVSDSPVKKPKKIIEILN
jgi:pyrimidine-nucleoside phosphorylase